MHADAPSLSASMPGQLGFVSEAGVCLDDTNRID
jgi:hypothetical protein